MKMAEDPVMRRTTQRTTPTASSVAVAAALVATTETELVPLPVFILEHLFLFI